MSCIYLCLVDGQGEDRNELKRHIYGRSVDRLSVKKLIRRVFAPCKCSLKTHKETTWVGNEFIHSTIKSVIC